MIKDMKKIRREAERAYRDMPAGERPKDREAFVQSYIMDALQEEQVRYCRGVLHTEHLKEDNGRE